jgi:hypothetical protein
MPKKHTDLEALRRARVRQLFAVQYPSQATGNDVFVFFGWLEGHYPELLHRGRGDPYQHLKVDLHGLYRD